MICSIRRNRDGKGNNVKYKNGAIYRICFLDHVEDGTEALNFTVYGVCVRDDKESVVIGCWVYTEDHDKIDINTKIYTIVKSTITDSKELTWT